MPTTAPHPSQRLADRLCGVAAWLDDRPSAATLASARRSLVDITAELRGAGHTEAAERVTDAAGCPLERRPYELRCVARHVATLPSLYLVGRERDADPAATPLHVLPRNGAALCGTLHVRPVDGEAPGAVRAQVLDLARVCTEAGTVVQVCAACVTALHDQP